MTDQIDYYQLTEGYQFPAATYRLEPALVTAYLEAVEDGVNFSDGERVPPLAVAVLAMNSLSASVSLPGGSIHTQQEVSFQAPVSVGESITCRSWVSRRRERGRFTMMTVDLNVAGETGRPVLSGSTSFILPQKADA